MNDWSPSQIGIATLVAPIAALVLIFDFSLPLGVAGGVHSNHQNRARIG